MSCLSVKGGRRLNGEVTVSGAKNSVLPLLAATYICNGCTVLHNCPDLSDVRTCIKILEHLGCRCSFENGTITVYSGGCYGYIIPESLMRELRSSIVFLGAVAAKSGKAYMSLPGGCELGPRPIDLHIESLKSLGARFSLSGGRIECELPDGAEGTDISLKFPSVGATENIILASVTAKGITVIHNAAREPEIADLCAFLCSAGAKISGAGTDTVEIKGTAKLHGTEYTVMPDRIVAATYLSAVAACGGKAKLCHAKLLHILPVVSVLRDCGCNIEESEDALTVSASGRLKMFDTVSTQVFPGFPTDSGPPLVAAAGGFSGTGVFIENIFDNRFRYIGELVRFGAKIRTVGRIAVITGVKSYDGADVSAADLRGGAALTVAALKADGVSHISNVCYIDRGYDNIEGAFASLGADIKRSDLY